MEAELIRARSACALLVGVLLAGLLPFGAVQAAGCPTTFAGGSGLASDPFQVANSTQLQGISNVHCLGLAYVLTSNISLSGAWTPIGTDAAPFTGRFDGAGFTVSGLSISGATSASGLFGVVRGASASDTARIVNLRITGASISGQAQVGVLAGVAEFATISDVTVAGSVSGTSQVGGLVGQLGANAKGSTLSGSSSSAMVTATGVDAGGLIGYLFSGSSITSSSASGTVTTTQANVGGLVGLADGGITSSSASGTVNSTINSGNANAGGLVGSSSSTITGSSANGAIDANVVNTAQNVGGLVGSSTGSISESYASGAVTATTGHSNVGGLVGSFDSSGLIQRSFASGTVRGGASTGGLVGRVTQSSLADVYATGSVTGTSGVGGLIGTDATPSTGTLARSYAIGSANGTSSVGGLIGSGTPADVTASYWSTTSSGQSSSPGGGTARTTAQMQAVSNYPTWDVASTVSGAAVWGMCSALNDGLPFLQWYATGQAWSCDGNGSSASNSQGPKPWLQGYGRMRAADPCDEGWGPSWAQWMNSGVGGFTCVRTILP